MSSEKDSLENLRDELYTALHSMIGRVNTIDNQQSVLRRTKRVTQRFLKKTAKADKPTLD